MREYEINYAQFCWLTCVGCGQVFVKQDGDACLMFDTSQNKSRDSCKDDIASSFNISMITGYVAQAFEELHYGKSPKTGW